MKQLLSAKNLISVLGITAALIMFGGKTVFADHCESNYGGGENCTYNKRFQIDKDVRIEGDSEWLEDKVTGVKKSDIVEFRIKIKNLSDKGAGSFDNMKMEDFLPEELIKMGGSGLTEYWNDFEGGETKTFIFKAKIDPDEFDRSDNFEKCVVNKAEVRWDKKFEGSDTVAVCYGNGEPTELPKTGAVSDLMILGIGALISGGSIKLVKKFARK